MMMIMDQVTDLGISKLQRIRSQISGSAISNGPKFNEEDNDDDLEMSQARWQPDCRMID